MEFSARLRAAVSSTPLSLEEISAELEDLLGLSRDELREKLPARLPRGRSSTQRLTPEEAWENPASVTRVLA